MGHADYTPENMVILFNNRTESSDISHAMHVQRGAPVIHEYIRILINGVHSQSAWIRAINLQFWAKTKKNTALIIRTEKRHIGIKNA